MGTIDVYSAYIDHYQLVIFETTSLRWDCELLNP